MFLIATVQITMEYETHESYVGNTKHSNFMIIRTKKKLHFVMNLFGPTLQVVVHK